MMVAASGRFTPSPPLLAVIDDALSAEIVQNLLLSFDLHRAVSTKVFSPQFMLDGHFDHIQAADVLTEYYGTSRSHAVG